ncbi:MAG TPA: class I SAM-dependent methyltransferase [Vicinamibacterales bacterium]|nr:class I SAM-dependent methyltransferase [Vicinamibacterales bacterium]
MSRYYPNNYYSYRVSGPTVDYKRSGLQRYKISAIVRVLTRHYYDRKTRVGEWIARRSSVSGDYPLWIRRQKLNLGLSADASILDVGCGNGKFLLDLREQGFSDLTGIDPFIQDDIVHGPGVKILKRALNGFSGQFDFIMLHHSFEHMPDPLPALRSIHELLKPNRYLLLRIPVAGCYGWRQYQTNWVSLDAPRHFFLHTRESIRILASQSGFELAEQLFDSDGLCHWGSELYRRDIPLMDERSPWHNPAQETFTKEELRGFVDLDAKLNDTGEADCSAFYLYKR